MTTTANQSALGKQTPYCHRYDPSLLFPVPRQEKRDELGVSLDALPFFGQDVWTGFEISWLNDKGKPQVGWALFFFPASSPFLIESKSFKLYLNSFNGTRFASAEVVKQHWITDLSQACAGEVSVQLFALDETQTLIGSPPGDCLDNLDIDVSDYQVRPGLLKTASSKRVSETLYSHLLKSNCLVTGQPDWGTIVIRYEGSEIQREGLLKYLVSFREHNEFHEQCVERVFMDLMHHCQPEKLTVYARYVRRGGLDINPYRSNFETEFDLRRLVRQ